MIKIFCKACDKEISWLAIPFYSTHYCNPICEEIHYRRRDEERIRAVIEHQENAEKQRLLDEEYFSLHRQQMRQKIEEEIRKKEIERRKEEVNLKINIKKTVRVRNQNSNVKKPPAKLKVCDHCKKEFYLESHYPQAYKYCHVRCAFAAEKEKAKQDRVQTKKTYFEKRCAHCKQIFQTTDKKVKYCGQICIERVPIKKSNDNWLERDYEKMTEEQRKRARKASEYLNKDHVKKTNWTGKNYKAVRG